MGRSGFLLLLLIIGMMKCSALVGKSDFSVSVLGVTRTEHRYNFRKLFSLMDYLGPHGLCREGMTGPLITTSTRLALLLMSEILECLINSL